MLMVSPPAVVKEERSKLESFALLEKKMFSLTDANRGADTSMTPLL